MSLLERLKEETREQHEVTERLLLGPELLAGTVREQDFLTLLYVNLSFHDALERALSQHDQFFADFELAARRKTPFIEADLQRLKVNVPESRPALFTGWNCFRLLGATYVAEGSTLGGRLISHALQKNSYLPTAARQSVFYQGYGDLTGVRWRAFREFLLKRAQAHEEEVIEGAIEAFGIIQQLFIGTTNVLHQIKL